VFRTAHSNERHVDFQDNLFNFLLQRQRKVLQILAPREWSCRVSLRTGILWLTQPRLQIIREGLISFVVDEGVPIERQ